MLSFESAETQNGRPRAIERARQVAIAKSEGSSRAVVRIASRPSLEILFDGNKRATKIHRSYIEADDPESNK